MQDYLTRDEAAQILKHFIALKSGEVLPVEPVFGICYEAGVALGVLSKRAIVADSIRYQVKGALRGVYRHWPKYSGNPVFPVPGVDGEPPDDAYYFTQDMWDRNTEYGRMRWELLDFLIAEFEGYVNDPGT